MEHLDRTVSSYDEVEPNMLRSLGFLLDRFQPDESRSVVKRLLLRRGESIEEQILEETQENGWYYAKLSPITNRKIMALLKIGYEFVGSYSEQLYVSLKGYIDQFKQNGFVFDNLWDVCFYLEILLNLAQAQYDKQIQDCVSLLDEALNTVKISKQLKSYIVWLLRKASKSKKMVDVDKLLDDVSNSPLEIGLWILFVCLDIGMSTTKMQTVLEGFVSKLKKDDLWKESTQIAFLAFASSVLKRTDSYLKIPYPTLSAKETTFFGIVAETLLKAVLDLEKEKKTLDFDENSLRNRFLAVLKTRFRGLASAETFRCRGLTDITVINPENHYEEVVIECKIWRGKKYYQQGIEQAMSYLTKAEDRIIILVFFKSFDGLTTLRDKLAEAIKGEKNYVEHSLSDGIVDPSISPFGLNYLFSRHSTEDQSKVGIHHIYAALKK